MWGSDSTKVEVRGNVAAERVGYLFKMHPK